MKGCIHVKVGRYLVHNSGVELEMVGGPYKTQREFEKAIVKEITSVGYGEHDTLHMLCVDKHGLSFSEFSNGFMDKMMSKANEV